MAGPVTDAEDTGLGESRFRALAQTAPDAIVTGDAENRILYVNPAAERLFGHPASELVGRPLTALMPERLRRAHESGYRRYIATGHGRLIGGTVEVIGLRSDGREFPIELSLGAAGDGAERILTAVIRDLTERRRRERHLAAQLAVTAVLAEPGSAAETGARIVQALTGALGWDLGVLWLLDEEGCARAHHVWQADPAATADFARASEELRLGPGRGLVGAALAARRPLWLDDFGAAPDFPRLDAARASGLRAGVCLPLVPDDRPFGALECWTAQALPVDDELRDALVTVASQVGEHLRRRETEARLQEADARFAAELERSNAELEAFAHVAAHDLRTPLQTIAGFTQLLERRYGTALPPEGQEFLRMILTSAANSGQMLTRLLDYARAGGAEGERGPVDPKAAVDAALLALDAEIDARGARVVVGELAPVVADPTRLGQVFQNLLANALKFTPQGRRPEVVVTAERDDDTVRFSVADRGMGVAPEEAEALFGMFRRGAGREGRDGTGIGLAVCAKVIAGHGGRIWAEPRAGGGSVFSFTLPAG